MWAGADFSKSLITLLQGAEQRMRETAKIVEREHVKLGQKSTSTT